MHPCEEDLVCKGSIEKVPYFNAPIYLANKSQVGKVDEIFGPMNEYVRETNQLKPSKIMVLNYLNLQLFSVKLLPDMKASSFKADQKVKKFTVAGNNQNSYSFRLKFSVFYRSYEVAPSGKIPPKTKE